MTARDRADLLRRVGEWHQTLDPTTRPTWDDVEMVTRLGVTDAPRLAHLILDDRQRLKTVWAGLRALTTLPDAGVPSPGATSPSTAQGAEGSGSSSHAEPDPAEPDHDLESRVRELGGLAGERLRALLSWRSGRVGDADLEGVSDSQLTRLAKQGVADPRVFSRLGALANYKDELTGLLGDLRTAPGPAPVPTPGPGLEPQPVEAGSRVEVEPPGRPAGSHRREAPGPEPVGVTSREQPAEPTSASTGPAGPRPATYEATGFAPYDYEELTHDAQPASITSAASGAEAIELSWPATATSAPVQIFRVVTNTSFMPDEAPELGKVIVATSRLQAVDSDPFTTPVRYVAVWVNEGASEQEAKAAQPRLHATGGVVLPVRHLHVREDEGTVIGQWTATDGLERIDVFRVPIAVAREQQHYNAGERLPTSAVTQGGFKDQDALPGAEYEYRVFALASISGDQEDFSPYVSQTVRMQAVVRPVDDLVVEPHQGSDEVFDLTWTMPPQGVVEIYRNEAPPASGIDLEMITRSALERAGLVPDMLLRRPTDRVGEHGQMVQVPWPEGWSRAYFTPVTVLNDDMIRVGRHRVLVRARPVSQVQLIERVDEQFLTFAWPDGVVLVKIYQGPKNTELTDPDAQPAIQELSEDEYRKYGGVHLRNALPREGCSVHVVATSYSQGRAQYSAPVTVQYEGLVRLSYDIVPVEAPQGGRMFGGGGPRPPSTARRVVVRSDQTVTNIPVVLVHHPTRLPLHPGDGQEVERRLMNFNADTEMVFMEHLDLSGRQGVVRVLVDAPAHMAHLVAVLDPEVSRLRCG